MFIKPFFTESCAVFVLVVAPVFALSPVVATAHSSTARPAASLTGSARSAVEVSSAWEGASTASAVEVSSVRVTGPRAIVATADPIPALADLIRAPGRFAA